MVNMLVVPQAVASVPWKATLHDTYRKQLGHVDMTKDTLQYITMEVGTKEYVSTLTVNAVGRAGSFQGATPCKSKKEAENEVAKMVLQTQFPEAYQQAMMSGPKKVAPVVAPKKAAPVVTQVAKGQKRKAESLQKTHDNPKEKLNRAIGLLLGRETTKQDVSYTTNDQGVQGQRALVTTLMVPGYDSSLAWTGQPCESGKLAQASAAEVALIALEPQIAPLRAAKEEQKKLKGAEDFVAFKARMAAKQAAVA